MFEMSMSNLIGSFQVRCGHLPRQHSYIHGKTLFTAHIQMYLSDTQVTSCLVFVTAL